MNHSVHIIAERLWGVIALVALIGALYHIMESGWDTGKSALVFPGIAGAWYLTRRSLRRKLSARDEHNEPH